MLLSALKFDKIFELYTGSKKMLVCEQWWVIEEIFLFYIVLCVVFLACVLCDWHKALMEWMKK